MVQLQIEKKICLVTSYRVLQVLSDPHLAIFISISILFRMYIKPNLCSAKDCQIMKVEVKLVYASSNVIIQSEKLSLTVHLFDQVHHFCSLLINIPGMR